MFVLQRNMDNAFFCGMEKYEGIARRKWRQNSGEAWEFDTEDEAKTFRKEHNLPNTHIVERKKR
jgi:hypothetical protein